VDGSNVYNLLPNVQAGPPPGFSGGCSLLRNLTPLQPSTSLDGSLIAFESAGSDPGHRAWVMNGDGTGARQVTFPDPLFSSAEDRFPVISPDGTRIAFRSPRTADGSNQLFVVNVDGSGLSQITSSGNVVGLTWSPDSTQLAYSGFNFPGFPCPFPNEGLKIINADGSGERFLACNRFGASAAIDWSSDGTRIGFVDVYSIFGVGRGISQVAPDGTRLGDITPDQLGQVGDVGGMNGSDPGTFRYSPDGTRLAYAILDAVNHPQGISLINVDGTSKQDVIIDHNYHHFWWQPGPAVLTPTALRLAPDPLVVGPTFGQQLSPVLKDSAGNILSRSANGYCTGDGRFARPDQLGFVISPFAGGPATPMVVTNGGLASNVITALPQATDPPVSINPKAWDFGNQGVATASATQVFTLTNTGTAALNISDITVTGMNAVDFVLDPGSSTCPIAGGTVNVGDSCGINVFFMAGATGSRSAQVTVNDDATGSPHIISLLGSGT
jgi:hypothetical protein